MKYEKGDKFIIEIKSKLANGLYRIKGFNTLVFDDHGLDRLEQIQEHDGCDGCKYEFIPPGQEPCESCCWNYTSSFEPKTEEIQVGDEVKYTVPSTKISEYGLVLQKHEVGLGVIDANLMFRMWNSEQCTRTGKTYPDLIKALEQLPKE